MRIRTYARGLAWTFALCLCVMALCAVAPLSVARADDARVGSITLTLKNRSNDVALRSGVVSLYRVATVDRSGANPRYDVSGGQFASSNVVAGIADLTKEELDEQNEAMTSALIRFAIREDVDPIASCAVTGASEVRFAGLEEGLYLVRQTRLSQDKLTMNPFILSVPYEGQLDVVAYPKSGNDKGDSIHPGEEDYEPEEPEEPDNPDEPDKPGEPDNPTDEPDEPGEPGEPGEPDEPGEPGAPDKPGEPDEPDKPNGGTPPNTPPTDVPDGGIVTRTTGSTVVGGNAAAVQGGSATVGGHVPQTGDALVPAGAVAIVGVIVALCGVVSRATNGGA